MAATSSPVVGVGFHFRRAQDRPQAELVELAREADRLGYQTVWASEAWGRDAFVLLARLAVHTRHVRLATGIVNVWGRSAGTLAQAIATLDEVSDGRAVLGLGVSGPRVVERFHERPWRTPLVQLSDVTETVRRLLRGERLNGFALQFTPIRPQVPVYWGVYGPTSMRAAGALADGWLAGELPLDTLRRESEPFHRGAAEANRPSPPISYMLQVTACDTEGQVATARDLLRRDLAFRIGGLGPFHRRSLAERGFGEVCERVASTWAGGDRAAATAAVSAELMAAMSCIGSPDEVTAYVRLAFAAGIAEPVVTVPRGTSGERIIATLVACSPSELY